jgi:hypothetical protein
LVWLTITVVDAIFAEAFLPDSCFFNQISPTSPPPATPSSYRTPTASPSSTSSTTRSSVGYFTRFRSFRGLHGGLLQTRKNSLRAYDSLGSIWPKRQLSGGNTTSAELLRRG